MPDLSFEIVGVEPAARGLTPLLQFKLRITNSPPTERIEALLLNTQIQIQPAQRSYTPAETERLFELFGYPEQWGQTLRNWLWTHANGSVPSFAGTTEAVLPVQCTYDLNIATTKYFDALEAGEISLLFLFSGSVFYVSPEHGLHVAPISWNSECAYRMPAQVWRGLMEQHYPNSAWIFLRRDVLDRLSSLKRQRRLITWEEVMEHLLEPAAEPETEHGRRNTQSLEVPA